LAKLPGLLAAPCREPPICPAREAFSRLLAKLPGLLFRLPPCGASPLEPAMKLSFLLLPMPSAKQCGRRDINADGIAGMRRRLVTG
jgi:hypothetical protein